MAPHDNSSEHFVYYINSTLTPFIPIAYFLASIAIVFGAYKLFYGDDVAACFITGLTVGLAMMATALLPVKGKAKFLTEISLALIEIGLGWNDIDAGYECLESD